MNSQRLFVDRDSKACILIQYEFIRQWPDIKQIRVKCIEIGIHTTVWPVNRFNEINLHSHRTIIKIPFDFKSIQAKHVWLASFFVKKGTNEKKTKNLKRISLWIFKGVWVDVYVYIDKDTYLSTRSLSLSSSSNSFSNPRPHGWRMGAMEWVEISLILFIFYMPRYSGTIVDRFMFQGIDPSQWMHCRPILIRWYW